MATSKKHLYLASEVDIPTGEKGEKGDPKPTRRVGPGVLAGLQLTDKEIATLPRGIVRNASVDEIEADEQRAVAAERSELLAAQAVEAADLRAKQEVEISEAPEPKRAALAERHSAASTSLQEKHAKALNALSA